MKTIIFLFALIAFNSNAAKCARLYAQGYHSSAEEDYELYTLPTSYTLETCNDHVLLEGYEYAALKAELEQYDSITNTLNSLFEFSVEDFAFFNAACLIAFITGHSIGRVARILGKS